MILALTRNLIDSHEQKRTRSWKQLAMEEFAELHGKRIGILGVGNIGKEIAKKCKAMGMETLGMDIVQELVPFVDRLYPPAELQKLLSGSDFVVNVLPLTPETRGLIGEKELRAMKKEGILINVSRGGIVVEKDLIKALEQRWIAGACLDVFEEEPLSKESKLYELENVVFSPHVSSRSPYHLERVVTFALENLRLYIAGKSLKGLVDYKLGY
jgi:phosphoglycerate dehydrogenase-like enzyme